MNEIYEKTIKRLARAGVKDPTAQIIYLAEEIEHYRDKIQNLKALLYGLGAAPGMENSGQSGGDAMKKIKPIKRRKGRRIAKAIKLKTYSRTNFPAYNPADWHQTVTTDEVKRETIAAELGKDLLRAGVIKIITAPVSAIYGQGVGTIYHAEIRVALPDKEG